MMIISIINTKGGTAKTTTAMYLACAFVDTGADTTVVDLDQQGSASDWADRATSSGDPLPFLVRDTNFKRLAAVAEAGTSGGGVVIVDTPPGDPKAIDAAIDVADFVIVPSQASSIEIARVWETLPSLAGTPHGVLITSARLGTRHLTEATNALESNDVPVFRTKIPIRESIRATFGRTPTSTEGYADVVQEIKEVFA
ncbi:AAA family ATPase [Corynebacterium bovis]|uniref:nucleotide-binding protein n=1 Tax=Corynebacterium bovis TaxID=36808 RepID=UPI003139D49C